MKNKISVVLFVVALMWLVVPVHAQDDTDVRKELEAQYKKLTEAHDRKDLKAILALKTSDFHAFFTDGRVGDSKLMEQYSRDFLERNQPPFNFRFTIQKLMVSYNKLIAVAEVFQEGARYQDLEGKRRKVETSVMQREIWAKTSEGWKLKSVDNVREQKKFVDGKRVDPAKPYSSADPPYSPVDSGTGNPNAKCDEVVVPDKSHPVWRAIGAQYNRLAEAIRKKDVDALVALYTPDFHAVTTTGEVWTREQALAYQRNGLARVKETTHISNTILRLAICGDKATATVLQAWYRTQMMAGKLRRVETNAVQDEHWVRTPDGWKRGNIDEVKNGLAFVDGKRVNTNNPYDPEAPEYDPYDPHPKRPVAEALLAIITEKGIESALQSYRALKQSNDYYVSQSQLNALGDRLLSMKKVREAIEILKLNVEAYPQSANVYDSLGEAYMTNGDKELAIRNYQRAVELNPQNTNAIEMLKKLRSQ
jgi:ketosteroid isomerase-like protein